MTTPTKPNTSGDILILTPVRFLNSPEEKSPTSNAACCKARLDVILKSLQDNYTKWQLAHKRGLPLCTSIEAIKTRFLQSIQYDSKDDTIYPNDLLVYCDKLLNITTIFEDITKNAKDALRQLQSLAKLPGSSNSVFYRSWHLEHFIQFLSELVERYEQECEIKRKIMKNLPHCLCREDLIRYTCAWEYPQYVDSYTTLMFAFLSEEIHVKKIQL